jgi:prepilin-type N-terminal cleavage/methylation domain-containing protein
MSILKSNDGFTFLEVMIAFSIISLVLIGIYQLQTQNIALGAHARFNVMAPMLAQQKAAEILSDPDNFLSPGNGDFGEDLPEYRWRTEISDFENDYFGETAKRIKKIDIYIETEEQSSQYHLRTYYFFDQES